MDGSGSRFKSPKKPCPRRRCCHYRRQKIQSKGAILIVFWTALMSISYSLNHGILQFGEGDHWSNSICNILKACLYVFFPISGWIADTYFGRYRVINTGLCISLVGTLFSIVTQSLRSYFPFDTIQEILIFVGLLALYVSSCYFAANIIQFATDQMIEIGVSGEQLSALMESLQWDY